MIKLNDKNMDTSARETVNVSKLLLNTSRKVRVQPEPTSVPLSSGGKRSLTTSAAPDAYYVSLTETSEISLSTDE